ncbi:hypothetical protein MLD38_025950 [Melastoma candidum]|uniref:Uncharacterized protein n=1 Tax=Melastoma candidum TaxID=119954 RepID=A0ACB9P3U1_9MYRT|nr:hypothetical protein MLD38_025950 [Melastoma candidum]
MPRPGSFRSEGCGRGTGKEAHLDSCLTWFYRKALRSKYGLVDAPCGDFVTHIFCHLCAVCQEYREIRERSADPSHDLSSVAVIAPPTQTMESPSKK